MGWIHDTGYSPAYDHEGYTASILMDSTDTGASSSLIEPNVIGWRAACECGWRGIQFYPRAEWPSPTGGPPEQVDGWTSGEGAYADWDAHLRRVLPDLAVHDLAQLLRPIAHRLDAAVQNARRVGMSWSEIGRAAGVTSAQAQERWGGAGAHRHSQRLSTLSVVYDVDWPTR
jgi:hypothetical protein